MPHKPRRPSPNPVREVLSEVLAILTMLVALTVFSYVDPGALTERCPAGSPFQPLPRAGRSVDRPATDAGRPQHVPPEPEGPAMTAGPSRWAG
jgi:hypothetical protein